MLSLPDQPPASPAPGGPDRRPLTLWCGVCGRTQRCTPEEMLRHTREGWPKCCGQVMSYFAGPTPETNNPAG